MVSTPLSMERPTMSKESKSSHESCHPELTEAELEHAVGGLKIDGIDGESQDDKKKNHIEVLRR